MKMENFQSQEALVSLEMMLRVLESLQITGDFICCLFVLRIKILVSHGMILHCASIQNFLITWATL